TNMRTLNPYQGSNGGSYDAYIVKLNAAGTLVYATYLGGSKEESAKGIAVDGSGNVYVAGSTNSTNFPLANAVQSTITGQYAYAAFVTKLNPSGNGLVYSTYLGGGTANAQDQAWAIAVDASGNAYVTGSAYSNNFPITSGAYQTSFVGQQDAFVTKLRS